MGSWSGIGTSTIHVMMSMLGYPDPIIESNQQPWVAMSLRVVHHSLDIPIQILTKVGFAKTT